MRVIAAIGYVVGFFYLREFEIKRFSQMIGCMLNLYVYGHRSYCGAVAVNFERTRKENHHGNTSMVFVMTMTLCGCQK